jgi:hypothetical protein
MSHVNAKLGREIKLPVVGCMLAKDEMVFSDRPYLFATDVIKPQDTTPNTTTSPRNNLKKSAQ